jgi:Putative lumazine-binding
LVGDRQTQTLIAPASTDDLEAITAAARDYIEGWFDGDSERMRRCLHPDLVKRTIWHEHETGAWSLGRPAGAEAMIGGARDGVGRKAANGGRPITIEIEDVFRHIASVKVLSGPYMDYLHLAKIGDEWLIVNVLWELREGERAPS